MRRSTTAPAPVLAALLTLACCAIPTPPTTIAPTGPISIPTGTAVFPANLPSLDTPLQLFTYKPGNCTLTAILLVFHGVSRNPASYRDAATPLAQRDCMLLIAPLFDEPHFPAWRYQRGGITHNGGVQPAATWTIQLVPEIIAWAQARESRPDLPYALLGHSAGAQFLSRVAAYGSGQPRHIVIANPSTWVEPSLTTAAPYGLAGAFPPGQTETALRRYLALPITVLLGREDTGSRNLATSDEAEDEGANRIERGLNVFNQAQAAARIRSGPFNWRLAIVPGVGHNARQMFTSDAAFAAFQP